MDFTGILTLLGFLLLIVGFVLILLGFFLGLKSGEGRVKGGGLIMVGPFPIVFGSDSRIVKVLMVIGIVLVIIYLAAYQFRV